MPVQSGERVTSLFYNVPFLSVLTGLRKKTVNQGGNSPYTIRCRNTSLIIADVLVHAFTLLSAKSQSLINLNIPATIASAISLPFLELVSYKTMIAG